MKRWRRVTGGYEKLHSMEKNCLSFRVIISFQEHHESSGAQLRDTSALLPLQTIHLLSQWLKQRVYKE